MANKFNTDPMDIIGQRFGKLTVIEYVGFIKFYEKRHKESAYRCQCDCGNFVIIPRSKLITNHKVSCGKCYKILEEDNVCKYIDSKGDYFIFDKSDLETVKKYRWNVTNAGYPVTTISYNTVLLSRVLLGNDFDYYVDHINGDTRDNRRCNLRLAKPIENQRNMKINCRNTTGYKGVVYRKDRNKFSASIQINRKTMYLGHFKTAKEAAQAYDKAARHYFGEFARLNFPSYGEQGCRVNSNGAMEIE